MMNACPRWSFLAVPVLAAFGCSDPVPLPAQGAVTLGLQGPMENVTQMSCPVGAGKNYQVGAKTTMGTVTTVHAPNDSDHGLSVIDGDSGTSVSCSVRKQADGSFAVSGSLSAASGEGDPITVTLINVVINSDLVNGTGEVSVFTPQLATTFDSGSTPCTFNVINKNVKGGSIWMDFACPAIAKPPSSLCSIMRSTIVFENCSGS
ncbi:MAG: hypothetical protein ABI335_19445 [Polyangiaceae bacterium]